MVFRLVGLAIKESEGGSVLFLIWNILCGLVLIYMPIRSAVIRAQYGKFDVRYIESLELESQIYMMTARMLLLGIIVYFSFRFIYG
ncbi:MAG: hypothetical protein LBP87_13415 [Planctomycetaceae bacterium]|jgi:hypothetical protein|nr:hypothetical protein [Planctomycetaceae bacterium]